jgi:DNA-binding SARP family transcriptional activator
VPRVEGTIGPAHVLQRRDAALLALVAVVALGRPVRRAQAAAHVWPDAVTECARNNLRQRLFRLRRSFGVDLLGADEVLALAGGLAHDLEITDAGLLGDPQAGAGCDLPARRRHRVREANYEYLRLWIKDSVMRVNRRHADCTKQPRNVRVVVPR